MKTIDNKTKNMNKVLKELVKINNHKYKYLIKDIIKVFKTTEIYNTYEIDGFMFNKDFPLIISISKNVKQIYLRVSIYNQDIYRIFEDEYFIHTCLLHLDEYIINNNRKLDECLYLRIIKIIDYVEDLRKNYIYSKYHDALILKYKILNKTQIDMDKDRFCKREIFECIVCYEPVNRELKSVCCKKHICRVCSERIRPLKCPNCRCEFY